LDYVGMITSQHLSLSYSRALRNLSFTFCQDDELISTKSETYVYLDNKRSHEADFPPFLTPFLRSS